MTNNDSKMNMQDLMKQALAKKKQNGTAKGSNMNSGTQTKQMKSQLTKKPSLKGKRMGV